MTTVRTRKVKSETVIEHMCDFCGKKSRQSCRMCDRDTCKVCGHYNPDDWSDYPDFYCKPCWELPERARLWEERTAWSAREFELEDAWKAAAKAYKPAPVEERD